MTTPNYSHDLPFDHPERVTRRRGRQVEIVGKLERQMRWAFTSGQLHGPALQPGYGPRETE